MMRFLVVLLAASCTSNNPNYSSTANPDLSTGTHVDFAYDAAMPPAKMDLSQPPPTCSNGARACSNAGSTVCENGAFMPDRTCPMSSQCMNGYCGVPTNTHSCAVGNDVSESLCTQNASTQTETCQPFVTGNGTVEFDCDTPVGNGQGGAQCSAGMECASGICTDDELCFRACTNAADCLKGNAKTCKAVTFTVEGVSVSARSCE